MVSETFIITFRTITMIKIGAFMQKLFLKAPLHTWHLNKNLCTLTVVKRYFLFIFFLPGYVNVNEKRLSKNFPKQENDRCKKILRSPNRHEDHFDWKTVSFTRIVSRNFFPFNFDCLFATTFLEKYLAIWIII